MSLFNFTMSTLGSVLTPTMAYDRGFQQVATYPFYGMPLAVFSLQQEDNTTLLCLTFNNFIIGLLTLPGNGDILFQDGQPGKRGR